MCILDTSVCVIMHTYVRALTADRAWQPCPEMYIGCDKRDVSQRECDDNATLMLVKSVDIV
jgi:hypothetical protein